MVGGHATSVAMEDEFWESLGEIASANNISLNRLITRIDAERDGANLSSAIRLHVLRYFRALHSTNGKAESN